MISGLPGAYTLVGREGRHAERHRTEFDPVQRGRHGRGGTRRSGLSETGRGVVFRSERAFLPGAHRGCLSSPPASTTESMFASLKEGIQFARMANSTLVVD